MTKTLLELLQSHGFSAQRVGSKHGGEYHCECPKCGGKKHRLRVWPGQPNGRHGVPGFYSCRLCKFKGDMVQWFVDMEGMEYGAAFRAAGVSGELFQSKQARSPRSQPLKHKNVWEPKEYKQPSTAWRRQAAELVRTAHENLLNTPEQLAYLVGRGVSLEGVHKYKLGYLPGEGRLKCYFKSRQAWGLPQMLNDKRQAKPLWIPRGIVIPLFNHEGHVVRIRIRRHNEDLTRSYDNKYHVLPSSCMAPLVSRWDAKAYVLQETDFDAIAVDMAAGDVVGAVALGTLSIKPDVHLWPLLQRAKCVLNGLDFDRLNTSTEEGRRIAALHAEAKQWWQHSLAQCKRHPVPRGKDAGEFVECFEGDLRLWVLAGLPPTFLRKGERVAPARTSAVESLSTQCPSAVLELNAILQSHRRMKVQVSASGLPLGCRGPDVASMRSVILCQEPIVRKWLGAIGDSVVTYRNFMNPMKKTMVQS